MFFHVRVGSSDLAKSRAFYDNALGALGIQGGENYGVLMYKSGEAMYIVGAPREGATTYANGGTIGFNAPSADAIDKFHAAGLANGGTCEGAPGPREAYGIYAAYLRDPDGNKICAIAPAA